MPPHWLNTQRAIAYNDALVLVYSFPCFYWETSRQNKMCSKGSLLVDIIIDWHKPNIKQITEEYNGLKIVWVSWLYFSQPSTRDAMKLPILVPLCHTRMYILPHEKYPKYNFRKPYNIFQFRYTYIKAISLVEGPRLLIYQWRLAKPSIFGVKVYISICIYVHQLDVSNHWW